MLTAKEFKQLSDAIISMASYNINGRYYVDSHNVRVLISNYVDEDVDEMFKDDSDENRESTS